MTDYKLFYGKTTMSPMGEHTSLANIQALHDAVQEIPRATRGKIIGLVNLDGRQEVKKLPVFLWEAFWFGMTLGFDKTPPVGQHWSHYDPELALKTIADTEMAEEIRLNIAKAFCSHADYSVRRANITNTLVYFPREILEKRGIDCSFMDNAPGVAKPQVLSDDALAAAKAMDANPDMAAQFAAFLEFQSQQKNGPGNEPEKTESPIRGIPRNGYPTYTKAKVSMNGKMLTRKVVVDEVDDDVEFGHFNTKNGEVPVLRQTGDKRWELA